MDSLKKSKEIVLSFLNAMNKEDFNEAKSHLNENFTFKGPLGTRNGSEIYISEMKKMKFKYEIDIVFANENDVCVIYNIDMFGKDKILNCGLYHLENDKISSLKVIFDPRPALEK